MAVPGRLDDRPVVLLMSSNGVGMGHLTRLLAYLRRLPDEVRAHVVSLSQAVPVVARYDVPWEYIPSQHATGLDSGRWRALFTERVDEVVGRVRPAVLVFDGTHPYAGLDTALEAHPHTRAVWSRRAMWKPGRNRHQLAKEAWFDLVLEPGDLAAAADRGATVGREATRVRPVTLLDAAEGSDRSTARAALGLPGGPPLALVSLGAGTINDTTAELRAAADAARRRGFEVCVTQPQIAADRSLGDVHLVRHYPLAEHLAAFDVSVAACGYNSFHEHLRQGLPTVFVPNASTSLDDQVGRARYAHEAGWSVAVDTLVDGGADAALDELLDPARTDPEAARRADPGNGAGDAAAHLARLALTGAR